VVRIVSEEGTLNHATSPAAVSTASVSATLSTQDVVAHAFAKMLLSSEDYRSEAQATWMPGFSGGFFTALTEGGELGLITLADVFGGGGGARTFADGIDSGGIMHSMASRMCNVETIESRAPVLQVYRRELRDAGGPGRFRGGVGIEFGGIAHRLSGPGMFMTFASGVAMPGGRGLSGGSPGGAASSVIHRGSDVRELFAGGTVPVSEGELGAETVEVQEAKAITLMAESDFLISIVASGAGYGDPLLREVESVAADVAEGLVSAEIAASIYGVVVGAGGGVDVEGTERAREAIRQARLDAGRALGGATPGRTLTGGRVLHPVADTVEAVEVDGERAFRCTECGQRLGGYDEDYKQATSLRELALTDITPVNRRCSEDYVAREFSCPGCGTLVAVDIQARDEPILDEARFFGAPA
jgi:N-methylhydantoinase B